MTWEDLPTELSAKWGYVRDRLLNEVIPLMADESKGKQWVELLGRDSDSMRLGACIVIDFSHGAVPPAVFSSVLDYLDFSKEDARKSACWAFHDAMMRHPANVGHEDKGYFSCRSDFSAAGDPDAYARVIDIGVFIGKVLSTDEQPLSAEHPDDRARVKRMYFEREDEVWEDLERVWTGSMGRAFVTSRGELEKLLDGHTDPGYVVNAALGLGLVGREFVAVRYPSGLAARFHQPTALDSDWSNVNWYVSQGKVNSWGRTHCCRGKGPGVSERVHLKLPRLAGGFSGKHIGSPRASLSEDRLKLLEDAFSRL